MPGIQRGGSVFIITALLILPALFRFSGNPVGFPDTACVPSINNAAFQRLPPYTTMNSGFKYRRGTLHCESSGRGDFLPASGKEVGAVIAKSPS
jgi:hypothetical protein